MKRLEDEQKANVMIDQSLNDKTVSEVLTGVQIPLENVEYTIAQYLLAHGTRLDTETRSLLTGVRDCVGRVAGSTRRMVAQVPACEPRRKRA